MTKKHFIALADAIKGHNQYYFCDGRLIDGAFTDQLLGVLASFCKSQNTRFDRDRWLGYIRGENGPSGGSIKK